MKINNIQPSIQGWIPYISDRWFLSSGWTIDSINSVFDAKTKWESCQSCVNTQFWSIWLQSFQELTNTGQPDCVLQWNTFWDGLLSLYLKEKKINVSFFYHNTHRLLIVYFQMRLYSLSLGNRTLRDLSKLKSPQKNKQTNTAASKGVKN